MTKKNAMKALIVVSAMLLLIFTPSCSWSGDKSVDETLTRADLYMNTAPDSALAILSDSAFHPNSKRQKALYALLLTQARHKNYVDETNDSLISTAVDYFDGKGQSPSLMKALFYKSIINYNAKNYRLAMRGALRAKEMAISLNDTYWQARTAEQLARIFSATYFHEDAIKNYKIAALNYKESGIEGAYLYSLGDIALNYSNIRNHENTIIFTDSILSQHPSPDIVSYCAEILSHSYYKSNQPVEANRYADTLLKYSDIVPLSSSNYSVLSNIRIDLNQLSDAKIMLDSALRTSRTNSDSLSCFIASVRYYEKLNDTTNAFMSLKKVLSFQNKIERELIQQSSVVAQRDYYEDEMTVSKHRTAQRDYLIFTISILALSIITVLLLWHNYKIKIQNSEIELKMSQIILLRNEMEQSKTKLTDIKLTFEKSKNSNEELTKQLKDSIERQNILTQLSNDIFGDRIRHLNLFINQFYDNDSSDISKKAAFNNIKKEIEKLTDKSSLKEIERIVNTFHHGLISKMRHELPEFSEDDINFIILSIAGFNSRALSMFTGIKPNSTYMKRRRLIDRIRKIGTPIGDSIISLIENQ